ncbi:hypothetical protein [Porticoccus hydrocarbonoclasticus]|uniref:hypothetical protein n=1 Tax=Porticoccus hydrocarbonoclasticus TaxID=1073414 RepID=UPI0030EC9D59
MPKILATIALTLLTSICFAAPPPKGERSEYLVTEEAYFQVKRGKGVNYQMSFSLRKEITNPLYITTLFENPSDKKSPLLVQAVLQPSENVLQVNSPIIRRIKNSTEYMVEVQLFSDITRTQLLGKHSQKVLFNVPSEALRTFGIETF